MEKTGLISGYRFFINPRHLLRESYKIIFTSENPLEINKIINFGITHENITYIARYFGNYIVDFEVEVKNKEELQNTLIELRNRCTIQNIQIIAILKDIELNHYPFAKL